LEETYQKCVRKKGNLLGGRETQTSRPFPTKLGKCAAKSERNKVKLVDLVRLGKRGNLDMQN